MFPFIELPNSMRCIANRMHGTFNVVVFILHSRPYDIKHRYPYKTIIRDTPETMIRYSINQSSHSKSPFLDATCQQPNPNMPD